ncbi:heme peroxidase [Rhodocollybia butyracea]|uniref:Peroxidase n=1 Tax=Rhodocollybia butyracea TaxID=206335 RepID=A0A9P5Q9F6_9AGAR|nr:heme peroxidase [Rhodocollybia butyracea]
MLSRTWPIKAALVTIVCAVGTSYAQSTSTFQWPNALLGWADKQLFEGPLSILVAGCSARDDTTVAAQWLRIAYHDMSTHDIDNGLGGLDASIQFELDRPQNVGEGMAASLNDFSEVLINSPFFGTADVIALGAILAVATCGGPFIPFRAGRIDATVAGPATVPQPQESLATHTEDFRQMGFNATEMITLVACGHTLGGVRQVDFPDIIADSEEAFVDFDTTPAFDNTISSVSEYLQNTTQNVLVVGPNVTTRSDFRIFSSDGNATMQSLLDSNTFTQTCADLLERMINTVPSDVTLTQAISEPFNYVVSEPLFSYRNDTLSMATTLRVLNASSSATVTLFWADREGSFCPSTGCSVESSGSEQVLFDINFVGVDVGTAERYQFNATINGATSISKFWFEIDNNDGSSPITIDNNGAGLVIQQDSLFVDNSRSAGFSLPAPSFKTFNTIVVAVRGDATATASIIVFDPFSPNTAPPFLPVVSTVDLVLDETNPPDGDFTFFAGNISRTANFLDLTATSAGTTYTQINFDLSVTDFPFIIESSS